jgi:DNA-directed RNA polymerase subunit K/omega
MVKFMNKERINEGLNRYELARIIGARALQLSLGAPPLIEVGSGISDSMVLAKREFESDVIPIEVLREY